MSRPIGSTNAPERHEQWAGLAYVLHHGLPGYPPARLRVTPLRAAPDAYARTQRIDVEHVV